MQQLKSNSTFLSVNDQKVRIKLKEKKIHLEICTTFTARARDFRVRLFMSNSDIIKAIKIEKGIAYDI